MVGSVLVGLIMAGSQPKVAWRGVHLFVGPNALEFHKKLWTNVLLPLGYNKVVLQCEQTEWKCMPNMRGGINMKREDLRKLCKWYRAQGVEVIPLVESFGHVAWLAQKGKNLDLMMNPKVPFTVDPRKPAVQKLFSKLWAEVIDVTKPRTVHFGLDEVDFRGFPKDLDLVTKLWKIQIPFLAKLAQKHRVGFMLWGDEVLAPQESAMPASAGNIALAKERRSVLPKGSWVCDWHYQGNPDPSLYMLSLNLLRNEGFHPVASAWNKPKNIEGQCKAAISSGVGYLQTTWAGYELTQLVVEKNLSQFGGMITASDWLCDRPLSQNPNEKFLSMLNR